MKTLPMIRTTISIRRSAGPAAWAAFAVLLAAAPLHVALAQTAPSLGSAGRYAVLSGAAVTCTGSTLSGDVGSFVPGGPVVQTGCAITGTVHPGDASAVSASRDFLAAYNTLAALPPERCNSFLSGTLANVSLAPGVYCFGAAATVTGKLTLNGPAGGVWIFRVGTNGTGALTGTDFSVVMSGGGRPSDVYWWVADGVTMNTSSLQGNVLAGAASTSTGGSLIGRNMARAAVTMTGLTLSAVGP